MSEEWALEGLAKSNLASAALTCEAAAKEEKAGLDCNADAGCQQCRDTQRSF